MVKLHKTALLCIVLLFCGGLPVMLFGQQRTLRGTVQGENGAKLPGVTIINQSNGTGTTTTADGSFQLQIPQAGATLNVSYLGYKPQTITVPANQTSLDIIMVEDVAQVEEVVVTAFAAQKKINVTGAISSVGGSDIVATPVANIANALIGNSPGISGLQTSGEPGHNATDIKIRGISTYGSSTPLIVIDGVEQASERAFDEFNSMDANEIASISILKDASSTAVYGIKGANGVIIVTTKRGSIGKPTINFSSNFGLTWASQLQKGTTAYEYALMRNEAVYNEMYSFAGKESMQARLYDDYDLWKFKNNRDFTPVEIDAMANLTDAQKEALRNSPALYYASHDLYKEQFDKVAPQLQLNLNISGGTERVKYFTSLGFFQQEGITNSQKYYEADSRSNFQRYNFRSNFDIKVAKTLTLTINSAGQFGQAQAPGYYSDPWDLSSRYKTIMQYIYDANPFISPGIIDGKLINGFSGVGGSVQNPLSVKTNSSIGNQNAVANLLTSGNGTIYNSLLDNVIKLSHDMDYLTSGLKVHATASYQDNYNRRVRYLPSIPVYTVQRSLDDPNVMEYFSNGMGASTFESYGNDNWNKLYLDAGFDWARSFGRHNLSALALGKAQRYTMPSGSYNVPSGLVGFVGRVTYNFDNRYMAEFNAGYNGTEQFKEGERFGFFPAISAGWVPTSEKFFPKNDIVTFIKIRGSYGEVGNDNMGWRRFYYLPNTYNLGTGYYLGNSNGSSQNTLYDGVSEGTLGNPFITWERAKIYDVGVDMKLFKDKLSLTAEWFKQDRNSILTTLGTIPSIYGVPSSSVPPANVGITENHGYEVALGWTDYIGRLRYTLEADMTFTRNKVVYRAEANNPYYWMNETGFAIGQRYGYVSDGLYNTQEELANRPYHKFCADNVTLGDIRYKDLNGDGAIDEKDRAPIGYPGNPEYIFNFRAKFNYKGFDLRILFTGATNGSYYLNSGYTIPFFKTAGNAWQWMYDNRWTPEKVANGEKISYPRATIAADPTHNNFVTSDYWLTTKDYFKIKNVEFGYTFSSKKEPGEGIRGMRVYVNANNLYTVGAKRLKEIGIDPESGGGGTYIYPLTQIVNLGISLQF